MTKDGILAPSIRDAVALQTMLPRKVMNGGFYISCWISMFHLRLCTIARSFRAVFEETSDFNGILSAVVSRVLMQLSRGTRLGCFPWILVLQFSSYATAFHNNPNIVYCDDRDDGSH